jgi:hypothetical protein
MSSSKDLSGLIGHQRVLVALLQASQSFSTPHIHVPKRSASGPTGTSSSNPF